MVLTDEVLTREHKRVDEDLLYKAIEVIDRHLRRTIDNSNVVLNFAEVRTLIRNELEEKYKKKETPEERSNWFPRWLMRRRCLSKKIPSKSRDVMLNALIRLLRLDRIDRRLDKCQAGVTEQLSELNRISKDSIGQRLQTGRAPLPRIGDLLFKTALRRAEQCLPEYQSKLKALSETPSIASVHKLWSQILEHRFEEPSYRVRFGTSKLEEVLSQDPEGALELIGSMPFAVEENEVAIVRQFLDTAGANTAYDHRKDRVKTMQHAKYMRQPCSRFISITRSTIESLDFDLQVDQFVASGLMEDFQRDAAVHRMRAYHLMCVKLLGQTERTLELIAPDEQRGVTMESGEQSNSEGPL